MHGSCLALLLFATLSPSFDPPAEVRKPLSELGQFLTKQGYTAVPLFQDSMHGNLYVRVKLDGHAFTLNLDTGAGYAFNLTKAAGNVLGISSNTDEFENEPWSDAITTKKFGRGIVREVNFAGIDYHVESIYSAIAIDSLKVSDATVLNLKLGKDESVKVDGLLGQGFLSEHSAVIDHDTATLYLIPLAKKDGPKLIGRWECVSGERDGKPLDKPAERWVEFGEDGTADLHLDGKTASGSWRLRRYGENPTLIINVREKGELPRVLARGNYHVSGERLKWCLIDEPVEPKVAKWEGVTLPTKFEAKKDSGYLYYEFKRVKAEKK